MAEKKVKLTRRERGKLVGSLLRDIKPISFFLVLSTLIAIGSLACSLLAPELTGNILNTVYAVWEQGIEFDFSTLLRMAVTLLAVYLGAGVLTSLKIIIMNNVVSRHFTCSLRIKLSEKIKRLPVKFIDNTPNGEVLSRMMNDVSTMGTTVHHFLDLTIVGVIQLIAIVAIMFSINYVLAIVVIAILPLSLIVSTVLVQRTEKHFDQSHVHFGKMYTIEEEDYGGFETVKAYNLEAHQNGALEGVVNKLTESNNKGYYISAIIQPIIAFLNNIAYVAICVIGGIFAINGTISVGDVVAVVLYAKMFSTPLESIANGMSMLQRALAASKRVYALLETPEMTRNEEKSKEVTNGVVEFKDVNFSYVESAPLIRDLNLHVEKGQKVAIVGPTGAGKTTIVNLLMRFYDVDSGDILIDGESIYSYSRESLREKFAMVLQDTWLFNGTVYDNIAYGKAGATREQMEEAARKAHVEHFISTLPHGYDTVINEESTNVSAGQKQLLTIARAFLADRPMLILDEATSNVDTRMEILIHSAMDELMSDKTSFVIAHRLSTIVDADVIIVIRDGQIVEKGTHESLLAKNGFYTEIYNSQYALLK